MAHLSAISEAKNLAKVWTSLAVGRTYSRPISVNLIVTSRCNSRCVTCDLWQEDYGELDALTLADIERLCQDFRALGIPQVALAGGEAMLRKDLPEIVAIIARNGIFPQLTTGMPMIEKQLEALVEAGLRRITLSMDGHNPQLYQAIRGRDWFDKMVALIELAKKRFSDKLRIDTNTVISSLNLSFIPEIIRFLDRLGSQSINLSPIVPDSSNNLIRKNKQDLFPNDQKLIKNIFLEIRRLKQEICAFGPSLSFLDGVERYLLKGGGGGFACYAGYLSVDIYSDGNLRLCGSTDIIGNVIKNRFSEVWFSKEAQFMRKKMGRGECSGCYLSCKLEPSLAVHPVRALNIFFDKKVFKR